MIRLLEGVRVLECAVLLNGDQTGRLLGDLGADVIKLEQRGRGDYLRDILGQITPHNSPAHLYANRNKRSIALDLQSDVGREIFFELLSTADVFVDGLAGDACERLGIGYEAQLERNPAIVYAQCSGFGSSGPYAGLPTHGHMMGALAGGVHLRTGDNDEVEVLGGLANGVAVGATNTALTLVAALLRSRATGRGCRIDGAGSDAVIATEWFRPTYHWNAERLVDRSTLRTPGEEATPRYTYYVTKDDRYVLLCAIEAHFWSRFCEAAGLGDAAPAESGGSRAVSFGDEDPALGATLRATFRERTLDEWMDLAVAHRIPMCPANQVENLRDDPQLASRQIIHDSDHPVAGPVTMPGWPAPVRDQPFEVRFPAPALGEHTSAILGELGWTADRIDRAMVDGVVAGAS